MSTLNCLCARNNYQPLQVGVTLNPGVQVFKMVSAGGFNMISFDLQLGTVTPPAGGTESSVNNILMTSTSANEAVLQCTQQ